jgi:hypothetical protein
LSPEFTYFFLNESSTSSTITPNNLGYWRTVFGSFTGGDNRTSPTTIDLGGHANQWVCLSMGLSNYTAGSIGTSYVYKAGTLYSKVGNNPNEYTSSTKGYRIGKMYDGYIGYVGVYTSQITLTDFVTLFNKTRANFGVGSDITLPTFKPIYNIDSVTKRKTGGFSSDSNSSSLIVAIPCDISLADVSNSINSSSNTKAVTIKNSGSQIVSTNSYYYGYSFQCQKAPAVSGGSVEIANLTNIFSNDFTLEMWFRPTQIQAGKNVLFQIGSWGTPNQLWVQLNNVTNSHVRLDINGLNQNPVSMLSTATYPLNNWYHFAFVRTGGNFIFYINGISDVIRASWNLPTVTNIWIGGLDNQPANDFYGQLQDIRLYTSAKYTGPFVPNLQSSYVPTYIAPTYINMPLIVGGGVFETNSLKQVKLSVIDGTKEMNIKDDFSIHFSNIEPVLGNTVFNCTITNYNSSTGEITLSVTPTFTGNGFFYVYIKNGTGTGVVERIIRSAPINVQVAGYTSTVFNAMSKRFVYNSSPIIWNSQSPCKMLEDIDTKKTRVFELSENANWIKDGFIMHCIVDSNKFPSEDMILLYITTSNSNYDYNIFLTYQKATNGLSFGGQWTDNFVSFVPIPVNSGLVDASYLSYTFENTGRIKIDKTEMNITGGSLQFPTGHIKKDMAGKLYIRVHECVLKVLYMMSNSVSGLNITNLLTDWPETVSNAIFPDAATPNMTTSLTQGQSVTNQEVTLRWPQGDSPDTTDIGVHLGQTTLNNCTVNSYTSRVVNFNALATISGTCKLYVLVTITNSTSTQIRIIECTGATVTAISYTPPSTFTYSFISILYENMSTGILCQVLSNGTCDLYISNSKYETIQQAMTSFGTNLAIINNVATSLVSIESGSSFYVNLRVKASHGEVSNLLRSNITFDTARAINPTTSVVSFTDTMVGFVGNVGTNATLWYTLNKDPEDALTQFGSSSVPIISGTVTMTNIMPSVAGEYRIYTKIDSQITASRVSSSRITVRTFTLPDTVTCTMQTPIYAQQAPLSLLFVPADGVASANVEIYSDDDVLRGTGIIFKSGKAVVSCNFPVGSTHIKAKVFAPNGTNKIIRTSSPINVVSYTVTSETASIAKLTGLIFEMSTRHLRTLGDIQIFGSTQYTQVYSVFSPTISNTQYGVSGQWLQAGGNSIDENGRNWPWGSIEGGMIVTEKYGGPTRYHVAASTHRYSTLSDTLGGYGFYEGALPEKYWARVIVTETLVLPPCGICFSGSEGKLFGSGWIALPLFDFGSIGIAKDPLTWTFFCEAQNFSGPVCCYPPQFFARRVTQWGDSTRITKPGCPESFYSPNIAETLAFSGKTIDFMSVGGEIPDKEAVYKFGNVWKLPNIKLPAANSAWLADPIVYTERNYNQIKTQLANAGATTVSLIGKPAVLPNIKCPFDIRVFTDAAPSRIPMLVDLDIVNHGNAYIVKGSDAGKTLGRYYSTTTNNDLAPILDNNFTNDYQTNAKLPLTFKNQILQDYLLTVAKGGIKTITLIDGTTVRYCMVKFIEQPAIMSLAKEFPTDFTPEKLLILQSRFTKIAASNFTGQFKNSSYTDTANLTNVDPAMIISRDPGYVPVAFDSYPAPVLGKVSDVSRVYNADW